MTKTQSYKKGKYSPGKCLELKKLYSTSTLHSHGTVASQAKICYDTKLQAIGESKVIIQLQTVQCQVTIDDNRFPVENESTGECSAVAFELSSASIIKLGFQSRVVRFGLNVLIICVCDGKMIHKQM